MICLVHPHGAGALGWGGTFDVKDAVFSEVQDSKNYVCTRWLCTVQNWAREGDRGVYSVPQGPGMCPCTPNPAGDVNRLTPALPEFEPLELTVDNVKWMRKRPGAQNGFRSRAR